MKIFVSAAIAAIMLVASCQKEIGTGDVIPVTDGTITLSVSASLPDYGNDTKGSLVNTVRLAWSEGDVVYVYDNEKCLGTLTAALEEDSDKYAVLSGTICNSAASKLTLVAASDGMTPSITTQDDPIPDGITFSLATQDRAGAPYIAHAIIDKPASTDAGGIKTAFQLATSVIKVNCTGVKGGTPVSQVRLKGVNTSLSLVPSASGAPEVSSSEGDGMITRTNAGSFASASGEGIMSFSVAVLEQNANAGRMIYVSQEGSPGSASFSAAALTKGLSYNTVAQVCGPYKTVGGHSGVRLWEDGPYWATCNIGANNPSENGWYFMWGGLQSYEHKNGNWYKAGTDVVFANGFSSDWSNYRFGKNENVEPGYGFSKYPKNPATGEYDLGQLEPVDDIAVILWGSGWRMPDGGSDSDFDRLASRCSSAWVEDGDMVGVLVSGKGDYAGISVFFPAAGYGAGNDLRNLGKVGEYWSRDLKAKDSAYSTSVITLFFRNDGMFKGDAYDPRYYGYSIRPVID